MKKIEVKKGVQEEYEWNKKRIVIGLLCGVILIALVWVFISSLVQKSLAGKKVLSASDSAQQVPLPDGVQLPTKDTLEKSIDNVKTVISHLTSDNFNTSHSAIAKFVVDIQQIQKGKKNVVDLVCDFFCKKK